MEPNPPWADRVLREHWDRIEAKIGPSLMPLPDPVSGKSQTFTEYGCGHYGCVYPTRSPERVFKITTDMTEAVFVSIAKNLGNDYPGGIVKYDGVWELPGASHGKRRVFALVREEARHVGGLLRGVDRLDRNWATFQRVINRLTQFKEFAAVARDKIRKATSQTRTIAEVEVYADWAEDTVDWDAVARARYARPVPVPSYLKGARGAAYAVQACKIVAQEMIGEDVGYLIGEALFEFINEGLLLADVHANNVGQVLRGQQNPVWVITDPGHLVPLRAKWLDVEVEQI